MRNQIEFLELSRWFEDLEDMIDLREAREAEAGAPVIQIDAIEKEFGIQ